MGLVSELIQNISKEIEQRSGAKLRWAQRCTAPVTEWIPENQIAKTDHINLRTAEDTENGSVMKLRQFNPNSFLKESSEVYCRFPGCSSTTHRLKPINSSEKVKQDLFVCQTHSTMLMSLVSERCAEENVIVSLASYSYEDFSSYTYLIGHLEEAFTYHMKKSSTVYSSNDSILAEVFLNSRNFLIITNALLNPDEDNTKTILIPYMAMLNEFLCHLKDPILVEKLRNALREVMDTILQFFGIIYGWVYVGNPGALVGAGVGLLAGFLGAVWYAASPGMIIASSVVGFISGKLIGSGVYNWHRENKYIEMQKQQSVQKYHKFVRKQLGQTLGHLRVMWSVKLFQVRANADGDLNLELT